MRTASGNPPAAALVAFRDSVHAKAEQGLNTVSATFLRAVVQQLSMPGRGRYYASRRESAGGDPATRKAFNRRLTAEARRANKQGNIDGIAVNFARKLHRASSPGDSPAPDTANLARSGFAEKIGPLMRAMGVTVIYGAWLELGTGRIAPRPFMRPALARVEKALGIEMRQALLPGDRVQVTPAPGLLP
jgi:hypothetical protein